MNLNLAGIAQGMQAAKADAIKQQQADYQNWLMQTKKQEYADQLASAGITFNALGNRPPPINAYGGPAPTPPSPGQASVPMTPPVSPNGGMGGMQGQMAPPQATLMAQGGSMGGMAPPQAGGQPQGLMPYQTVQSLAQGNAPQGGGMNVANAPPAMQTQPQGTQVRSVSDAISLINANAPEATPMQKMMALKDMIPIIQAQNSDELNLLKQAQAMAGTWEERPVQVGDQIKYVMFNKMTGETKPMEGFGGDKWNPNAAPKTQNVNVGGTQEHQQWNPQSKTWETTSTAPRWKQGDGSGNGVSGAKGTTPEGIRAETYAYLINNVTPPKRTGEYSAVMTDIAKLAKENNMSTEQLITAGADIKSRVLAKRSFEIRAQNIERAENVLLKETPVFEDAIKDLSPSKFPALAKVELSAMRQGLAGQDALAKITKLDQAAEVVFNEFNGIITGNPGTLNVADVQNAHKQYLAATTPAAAKAAIDGMKRIIKNAKAANDETRHDIMGGVTDLLDNKKGSGSGGKSKSVNWEDLK